MGWFIRTGSVCEQRREDSLSLFFRRLQFEQMTEGSETQPKGGPFSVHTSALHLWGQTDFLKTQADY